MKCKVCKRTLGNNRNVIFIPFTDAIYIPIQGESLVVCLECCLSHCCQWHNYKDKDIEEYIDFRNEVENI